MMTDGFGKEDRDLVHGGGSLGLGKPEDLSHDDSAYFASREIVEKSGAG